MDHPELSQSPEIESKPTFDAALVHGYWLSQKGNDAPVSLSLRSHMATRAAAQLFDEGKGIGKIVLGVGHVWGPDYPSVASLMRDELEKYGVPHDRIIVNESGLRTDDEINFFLNQAREHSWENLVDIAFKKHGWSLPEMFPKEYPEVKMLSVEQILKSDDPHVKKLVERLGRSNIEVGYALYEGAKKAVISLGLMGNLYKIENSNDRVKRAVFPGDSIGLPMDDYSL